MAILKYGQVDLVVKIIRIDFEAHVMILVNLLGIMTDQVTPINKRKISDKHQSCRVHRDLQVAIVIIVQSQFSYSHGFNILVREDQFTTKISKNSS